MGGARASRCREHAGGESNAWGERARLLSTACNCIRSRFCYILPTADLLRVGVRVVFVPATMRPATFVLRLPTTYRPPLSVDLLRATRRKHSSGTRVHYCRTPATTVYLEVLPRACLRAPSETMWHPWKPLAPLEHFLKTLEAFGDHQKSEETLGNHQKSNGKQRNALRAVGAYWEPEEP